MTLDLFFLDKTINDQSIVFTLRFYLWKENCISIGYHQKNIPSNWTEFEKQGLIKIIKRPSGGGAVLHSEGITYALTCRKPNYKKLSYEIINGWLIKSFSNLGLKLQSGTIKKSTIQINCFNTNYTSDLIDENGYKRIGSAQYWKKGSFLQHGEIILNPPKELWSNLFQEKAPPALDLKIDNYEIIKFLKNSFLKSFSNLSSQIIYLSQEEVTSARKFL